MIKGVIFDMDGLIFDTENLVYQANQRAADELAISFDKGDYLRYLGISDEEYVQVAHSDYDADYGAETVTEFIRRAYAYTKEMFDAGLVETKPGVAELLHYLEEQGIQRILASSNNRPEIQRLLEQAGLTDDFPVIVSAEDVHRAKPDPAIFLAAADLLQLPTHELLVLEDSANGVKAALAAEIPVIMVPDLLEPDAELAEKTLAVLPDLHQVKDFLAKA